MDFTTITNLGGGTPKLSDYYPATDITDDTQAPSGTTKKYQLNALAYLFYAIMQVPQFMPVYASSTTNLSATYNNGSSGVGATLTNNSTQAVFAIDGVSPPLGSRVLIGNQTTQSQNGIYTVTTIGSASTNWQLTRATDADTTAELIYGTSVLVALGATQYNQAFQLTFTGAVTVGTTALVWTELNVGVPPYASFSGSYALGGIPYSTATSFNLLAPTTTALQMFQSGNDAAPTWSTTTWPATIAVNEILFSSSANVISGITATDSGTLVTSATGVPSIASMATNGYVLIGSAAGEPTPANITGSMGVTVTNGANTIALSGNNFGSPTSVNHAASTYTVLSTDYVICADPTAGTIQINMPNTPTVGRIVVINDVTGQAGTHNITVTTPGGSTTFNGGTTYVINANYASIILYATSTSNYTII